MELIRNIFKSVRLYMPGIFSVLVIYWLLIGIQQGIDVVIQAGEFFWHAAMGCLGAMLWSFLTWYSLRLLSYACQQSQQDLPKRIPTVYHRIFPRLIAYNCLLSIQAAIFNITVFSYNGWCVLLYIAAFNVLFFVLSAWFTGTGGRSNRIWAPLVCMVYVAVLLWLLFSNRDYMSPDHFMRYRFWLFVVALILFIAQVAILWLFIQRRKRIDAHVAAQENMPRPKGVIRAVQLNEKFKQSENTYFDVFNIVAFATTIVYLSAIFSISVSTAMGPMAFAVLALGIVSGFFAIVKYFSIQLRFSLGVVLLLVAVIIGRIWDPYEVRLTKNPEGRTMIFGQRPDLSAYLHKWIEVRKDDLEQCGNKEYKVFIVLSNGGASRAGNWVCSVLAGLQDSSLHTAERDTFSDHILFMAGASGGTVGNCAFYALLKENRTNPLNTYSDHAQQYFAGDFLTYTLGRMLGPDFMRHFIPLGFIDDRAAALAEALSNGSEDQVINAHFRRNISEEFDTSGHLPVLIINTTRVNDGMPGVISTVKLPKNSQRIDVLRLLDTVSASKAQTGDMTLGNASVLSARFPYVSPAGSILNNYFVDGGYFDNSGAGIILEYMEELYALMNNPADSALKKYTDKMSFYVLHLTNSAPSATQPARISPLANDLFAPMLTLGGMQGSSTKIGNGMLKKYFVNLNASKDSSVYDLCLYKGDEKEQEYPMSWVISQYQMKRMKDRCDEVVRNNYWKIKK